MIKSKFPSDRDFWIGVMSKFPTRFEAATGLNCDETTISRYMRKCGLQYGQHGKIDSMSLSELKDLIQLHGGIRGASRYLNIDHSTLSSRLDREGIGMKEIMFEHQNKIAPNLIDRETISGDCVIAADFHCPFVSLKWVDRAVEIGREYGVKQLLIAGDFFDFDRLSWWLKVQQAEDIAVKLEDELAFSENILEKLEVQYDKIHMIGGNHWKRLLSKVTYSISSRRLMGLVGRSHDSRYNFTGLFEWTLIDNKIRVTHPAKARKLDYTLARDLSILYPTQWIVVAHRHRTSEALTPDGKRPQIEIGWMGDTDRMRYVQHVDSTYYKWANGFAIYVDGMLRNYNEFNNVWKD